MKRSAVLLATTLISALPHMAAAQTIPPGLVTPDSMETRIGKLEFKDGAPTAATAEKVLDSLDYRARRRCVHEQLLGCVGLCDPQGLP